ncbi:hypothetical protein BCR34DRAFT_651768 [Clohesyomyces aquaticus]|uniref:Uncharacterized protein n=1 Tax=Clohesyomyces aquaticus TaxID=1231657 RepID=A0A1Y1ZPV1_9PLEO|nr:hypothetical protein BCR34DRAFT_651768 [Clohesyomyces aquaticus]
MFNPSPFPCNPRNSQKPQFNGGFPHFGSRMEQSFFIFTNPALPTARSLDQDLRNRNHESNRAIIRDSPARNFTRTASITFSHESGVKDPGRYACQGSRSPFTSVTFSSLNSTLGAQNASNLANLDAILPVAMPHEKVRAVVRPNEPQRSQRTELRKIVPHISAPGNERERSYDFGQMPQSLQSRMQDIPTDVLEPLGLGD